MKQVIIILFSYGLVLSAKAQDYFSDLSSGTTPIFFNTDGKALFSASINAGDNSVKAIFFRQYRIDTCKVKKTTPRYSRTYWGWGLNTTTKTTNGLGSLISTGQFSPDFSGGGYLSYAHMHWEHADKVDSTVFSQWAFILSGTVSAAKYQFYQSSNPFSSQLSDTNFTGRSVSLSFVKASFAKGNNLYYGLSITASRKNNYDKLDKVEIKDDSIFNSPNGTTRRVQTVNDDGYTYAVGNYQQYNNFNVRANVSFTPKGLSYQFAFILYPSIDYSKAYAPKYNVGLSFAHLKDGLPGVSDAALYLELNDMGNAAGKKGTFLKRAFKIGISVGFNVFGLN